MASIVALIAFAVGYVITTVAFTATSAGTEVALVPDVRGLTIAQAMDRLEDDGFLLVVGDSFPNAGFPEGSVLAQSPLPGQEVGAGTEVNLIVSTGQLKEVVPDVTEMSLPLAIRTLEVAGFQVMTEEAEGEGAVGTIVGVTPEVGTPSVLPAVVVLRVAISPPFWYMPNVIGLPEDSAVVALESTGLKVSEVRYETIAGLPPYQVAAQLPLAGDSVDLNTYVRVLVGLPAVESLEENRSAGGAGPTEEASPDPVSAPVREDASNASPTAPARG